MNEHELLAEYNRTHSAEIFRQIVERYVDFVFATARRQLRDQHLAEDVTQGVFLLLAKKAGSMPANRPVLAWLHTATRYAAANAARSQAIRYKHERLVAGMKMDEKDDDESHEQMSPLLDEGIAKLRKADRDAILLKFFEQKSHREIAGAMGISEEAAAKRVSRAVDRLRDFFHRRGVTVTSTAIGAMLATEATRHAPSGLAQTLGNASPASSSAAAVAKGAVILMTAAKIKTAVVAVIFIIIVLAGGAMAVRSWNENPPIVVEPHIAATSPSAWQIQYGDAKIALLAMGDPNDGTWWLPDGTPTQAPSQHVMSGNSLKLASGETKRRMLLLAQGIDDRKEYFSPDLNGFDAAILSHIVEPDGILIDLIVGYPTSLALSGEVTINFATGPWQTIVTYDVASSEAVGSGDFQVESLVGSEKETVLDARVAGDKKDRDVVAVMTDGKEQYPYRIQITSLETKSYYFQYPKNQIKQIVSRSRPYLKSMIQNVSLQSGNKTHPIVIILPTTLPSTNPTETIP